jgi:CheY-like chemotaxis protein
LSRLLIIEDNPDIADLYVSVFADQETVVLPDIPQALQFLSRHRPDLVITDFHLPSGTGAEIISHVRRHSALADVPILGVSVDDTMKEDLIEQGATAFLTKPLDIGDLINMAQRLLVEQHERPAPTAALAPEIVLEEYLNAYEAAYHRRPQCYWTGRYFLIDRQRCDQAWILSETERLKNIVNKQSQPRNALLRLIDKLRRV